MNKVRTTLFVLLCVAQQGAGFRGTIIQSHQTHLIHLRFTGTYLCSLATKGRFVDSLKASEVNAAITNWIAHNFIDHEWRVPDKMKNFMKNKHWSETGFPKQDEKACERVDYVATLDSQKLRVKSASEFDEPKQFIPWSFSGMIMGKMEMGIHKS